jgi:hypothetical protein
MSTKMNPLHTTLGILLLASLLLAGSAAAAPVAPSTPSGQVTPADQFPLTTIPVTVGQLGTTPITGIIVTGTALENIVVTAAVASGPETGTGVPLPFIVPQSWLDEHHIAPRDIVMYHRVGSDWQPLPTTLVDVTNGQANYTASSPGFSLFAITGQTALPATATTALPVAAGPAPGLPLKTLHYRNFRGGACRYYPAGKAPVEPRTGRLVTKGTGTFLFLFYPCFFRQFPCKNSIATWRRRINAFSG